MKKYTVHVSFFALILAFMALGGTVYQNWDKDWNSIMFAVAMLSGLVMILIGWNIYSLIDANRFKENIRKNIVLLEEKHETMRAEFKSDTIKINATLFDSVSLPYKKVEGDHDNFLYTFFTIKSIQAYSQIGEIDSAIERIDDLLNIIPTFSPIENEDKSFLISSLSKTKPIQNKEYKDKISLLNLALLEWRN